MTIQILSHLDLSNRVNRVKSKNKGEKSEKIADLWSFLNQPSAEGLA